MAWLCLVAIQWPADSTLDDLPAPSVPLLPFWFGSAFFTLMFLYSVFILPEALTPERREELMAANEATQEGNNGGAKASEQRNGQADGYGSDEDDTSDEEDDSKLDVFSRRFNFFRKLAILLPARDANTGKRDYRLFVLAIAFTIYRIAGLYTNDVSRSPLLGPAQAVISVLTDYLPAAPTYDNRLLRFQRRREWRSRRVHHR